MSFIGAADRAQKRSSSAFRCIPLTKAASSRYFRTCIAPCAVRSQEHFARNESPPRESRFILHRLCVFQRRSTGSVLESALIRPNGDDDGRSLALSAIDTFASVVYPESISVSPRRVGQRRRAYIRRARQTTSGVQADPAMCVFTRRSGRASRIIDIYGSIPAGLSCVIWRADADESSRLIITRRVERSPARCVSVVEQI